MKNYLVTGAAGFIGANYLKYILAKHDDDAFARVECASQLHWRDACETARQAHDFVHDDRDGQQHEKPRQHRIAGGKVSQFSKRHSITLKKRLN